MSRLEVATVFEKFWKPFHSKFAHSLLSRHRQALRDIVACRTAALGSHVCKCDDCGNMEISYNSCRNRHCPKCQASKRREWLQKQAQHLLDVEYFHVVFTLPKNLNSIALRNQREIYRILFKATADSIATIAKDPRHLGAQSGFTAVLHTWGQNLEYHPHLHCVVPGGGIEQNGSGWKSCRPGFFLPVRVLSRRFRESFIKLFTLSYKEGKITIPNSATPRLNWDSLIESLRKHEWVVYAKPPFGGPKQVLKYLARYTHRVAISNSRLINIEDGKIRFHWKDYRSSRRRTMSLAGEEFIRRFLMHVLPKGLMRIRHFGYLANCIRESKLDLIRSLLESHVEPEQRTLALDSSAGCSIEFDNPISKNSICPKCKKGHMILTEILLPGNTVHLYPG